MLAITLAEINQPTLQMVLLSLFCIYLASKVGGEITHRLGLTTILGELLGGAIVGISVLRLVVLPGVGEPSDALLLRLVAQLNPSLDTLDTAALAQVFVGQGQILANLSQIGVIILLFQVGLESNLRELVRVAPQAATAVASGITVPLTFGVAGLLFLFGADWQGALFAAAATTAVSIGISASILEDLDALTSHEGQLIIGAAVLDDITGILILTVISGIAAGEGVNLVGVLSLIITAAVFLVGTVVLSRLLGSVFVGLLKPLKVRGGLLMLSLSFCFGLGFLSDTLRLEALMGAFVAGLILSQTEVKHALEDNLQPVVDLLVPIFFVVTGARIDLRILNPFAPGGATVFLMGMFLATLVVIGRLGGAFLVPSKQPLNRLAIGIGMLPLGEVALVIAGTGVATGQMAPELSAAVILAIVLTVSITPGWLRWALQAKAIKPDRL